MLKKSLALFISLIVLCALMSGCAEKQSKIIGDSKGYKPWYLSVSHAYEVSLPEIPEELQSYGVTLPREYTCSTEGIEVHLNFFQNHYRLGELIQLEITVTNQRDQNFTFRQNSSGGYHPGEFRCSNGAALHINETCSAPPLNRSGWPTDDIKEFTLTPQETVTYECAFTATPAFFIPDEALTYTYLCKIDDVTVILPVTVERIATE